MEIVEEEQGWLLSGGTAQDVAQRVEYATVFRVGARPLVLGNRDGLVKLGDQLDRGAGPHADQVAEPFGRCRRNDLGHDCDQRLQRRRAFAFEAVGAQHAPAGPADELAELLGEPGAPGARGASHHDRANLADRGRAPGVEEQGQFAVSAGQPDGVRNIELRSFGHHHRVVTSGDGAVQILGLGARLDSEFCEQMAT